MTLHVPWHWGNTKRTLRVSVNESATGKTAAANAEPMSSLSLYFLAKKVSQSEERLMLIQLAYVFHLCFPKVMAAWLPSPAECVSDVYIMKRGQG